jgi:hypothetical protein
VLNRWLALLVKSATNEAPVLGVRVGWHLSVGGSSRENATAIPHTRRISGICFDFPHGAPDRLRPSASTALIKSRVILLLD